MGDPQPPHKCIYIQQICKYNKWGGYLSYAYKQRGFGAEEFRENSQRSVPHTVMVSGTSAAPSVCVYIYMYIYIHMYVLRFNNKRPAPFEDKTIQ